MLRGINRQNIFYDDEDYQRFVQVLYITYITGTDPLIDDCFALKREKDIRKLVDHRNRPHFPISLPNFLKVTLPVNQCNITRESMYRFLFFLLKVLQIPKVCLSLQSNKFKR